jgi:hypothetical protein
VTIGLVFKTKNASQRKRAVASDDHYRARQIAVL